MFFLPLLELCELDEKFLAEVFVAEKLDGPLVDGASAVDEPGLVTYSILIIQIEACLFNPTFY